MKKALSMILALAMVFALCACSSQQPASTTAAATTAAPKADNTQTEAPAEESSEGQGVQHLCLERGVQGLL